MLNPIYSLCVYQVEMVIAYIFFSNIFERRIVKSKCILVGSILYTMGSLLNLVFGNNPTVNCFTTFFIVLLFSISAFRATPFQYAFNTAILVIGNMALEMAVIAVSSHLTGNGFLDYNNNTLLFIFEAVSCKSLYYLFVLIVIRISNPKGISSKVPVNFLIYPITSTFCLFIFFYICTRVGCSQHIQLLLAIAGGCLFISSLLLFVTYSHQVNKESEAIRVKSELARIQTEKNYYQILDQQNQQLMMYAHDAKNHLAAIKSLNTDPQISRYISKLSEQLADYTHHCHSGNKLLDVMIHKYSVDCEMRGVCFDYDVRLCNLNKVEDIDLVAILGNLIDNAVSAAEKSEKKRVSLATAQRNSYSIIVITNSCDKPPKSNGNFLTTSKADYKAHGFGLKSVSKTLKKYQGDFEWEYDDNHHEFTVTVMVDDPLVSAL